MDMPIEMLGLKTMTHNFFLRSGCNTLREVFQVVCGERKTNIPKICIDEAKRAIQFQENILGVKFLED